MDFLMIRNVCSSIVLQIQTHSVERRRKNTVHDLGWTENSWCIETLTIKRIQLCQSCTWIFQWKYASKEFSTVCCRSTHRRCQTRACTRAPKESSTHSLALYRYFPWYTRVAIALLHRHPEKGKIALQPKKTHWHAYWMCRSENTIQRAESSRVESRYSLSFQSTFG